MLGARFFSSSHRSLEKSAGFTLTELLIVIAISTIISVVGFVSLGNYRGRQAVQSAVDEVGAVIRATRQRSMTQEGGGRWGVHFSNSSTSVSSYTAFRGYTYATGTVDRQYALPSNISFSNPFVSSTYDVVFPPLTGSVPERKVLSVVSGRGSAPVGDLVLQLPGTVVSRLEDGLVGYWHLDENASTTVYDASGRGNNSTASGTTWISGTNCKAGSCLSFGGANSYVSVADNANLSVESGSFTVSLWVYPNVVQQQVLLFKGNPNMSNGYILVMNRFGSDITLTKGGVVDQQISYTFQSGRWYNIVAVQPKGGNVTYYINGQLISSYSNTSNYSSSSGWPLYIGDADTYFANKFNGFIDEVRIYNRALSASEILNQYNDLK
ncbi:MAG: LamG-like jellyroll fold domain-containing protein [Candidatus Jorgensenbacteria bacterium]